MLSMFLFDAQEVLFAFKQNVSIYVPIDGALIHPALIFPGNCFDRSLVLFVW